jgi:hypothetical protein
MTGKGEEKSGRVVFVPSPHACGVIARGKGDELSLGIKGDALDEVGVVAAKAVPDGTFGPEQDINFSANTGFTATGCEDVLVWRECQARDLWQIAGNRTFNGSVSHRAEVDAAVTVGDERSPVWGKCQGDDRHYGVLG